jgi:hypothetical protein
LTPRAVGCSILAIRFATDRLTSLAKLQGASVTTTPEALFVCVHNACPILSGKRYPVRFSLASQRNHELAVDLLRVPPCRAGGGW